LFPPISARVRPIEELENEYRRMLRIFKDKKCYIIERKGILGLPINTLTPDTTLATEDWSGF
jgi:hypothetical protein